MQVPYDVCFDVQNARMMGGRKEVDHLLEALFALDAVCKFCTGFVGTSGAVVYDRRAIALRYLRGWFAAGAMAPHWTRRRNA